MEDDDDVWLVEEVVDLVELSDVGMLLLVGLVLLAMEGLFVVLSAVV